MLETLANDDDKYSSRAEYLIGQGGHNNKPGMYIRILNSAPYMGAQAIGRYPAYSLRDSLN